MKLRELLGKRGFDIKTSECKAAELVSKAAMFHPHAIVSTTHVAEAPVRSFSGIPLLTGVGRDKLIDDLATFLEQCSD